jgi:GntR family carbon starvation induced transcriptional regulator
VSRFERSFWNIHCRRHSPNPPPVQTLNASALSRLRSDIIACRLMPNERLRVETLRERYDMSIDGIHENVL